MRKTFYVLVAVALLAAAYVRVGRPGKPVAANTLARQTEVGRVAAPGRVEPLSEEIKIGAELDGKLRSVAVEEGQRVRRGQIIAVLENADYIARVAAAEAEVRELQAAGRRVHNGARPQERQESQALLREAEAVLDNARAERQRRESLFQRGAIARTEFESVDRELRVAQARYDATQQRLALVDDPTREEDRAAADAAVQRAQARVADARALLGKTIIRSPLDAVVLHRYLKTGESVSRDGKASIVSLGDTSRLRLRADVDETDVARIHLDQRAYATAEAYGDRKFWGRVVQIGQILGRKNVRTDEPTERVDAKILETLIDLDPGSGLPLGLRMDTYLLTKEGK